jgi:hypothetical protein
MRAWALPGKIREMLVWHSAQTLSPTKVAPGISGAAVNLDGTLEQEFNARVRPPREPTANAKAQSFAGFIAARL